MCVCTHDRFWLEAPPSDDAGARTDNRHPRKTYERGGAKLLPVFFPLRIIPSPYYITSLSLFPHLLPVLSCLLLLPPFVLARQHTQTRMCTHGTMSLAAVLLALTHIVACSYSQPLPPPGPIEPIHTCRAMVTRCMATENSSLSSLPSRLWSASCQICPSVCTGSPDRRRNCKRASCLVGGQYQ